MILARFASASSFLAPLVAASLVAASLAQTAPARAQEPTKARVVVEGTKPDVEISVQTSATFGRASNGTSIALITWKDLCVAPCAFDIEPGRQTLLFRRDGSPSAAYSGILRPGETRILVKPGVSPPHGVGYFLAVFGGVSLLTGGIMYGVGAAAGGEATKSMNKIGKYMALGGLGGLAAGIPLILLTGTDLEVKAPERGPGTTPPPGEAAPGLRSATRALGVGYATAF